MRIRPTLRAAILGLLAAALWLPLNTSQAEVYSYRDEKGNVHYSDSATAIPPRYRNRIKVDGSTITETYEVAEGTNPLLAFYLQMIRMGLNQGRQAHGRPAITSSQMRRLEEAMSSGFTTLILVNIVSFFVAIALVIHAFINGRWGWGIANFLFGALSGFFYTLMHVAEGRAWAQLIIIVILMAPIPVGVHWAFKVMPVMAELM